MENLAPSGNREALDRAVAAGADAVYLGCASFSARAGAGNFDEEGLREAVAFAHLHHVRVHVTVNTLMKDGEMAEALETVRMVRAARADAVLVQDLGLLLLIRARFPDLPVHASTQMAIHNASGVRWCRRVGMTRAVLARECSLAEIARCAGEGLEIEVFGHGAQCVGVSGECLMSSMAGDRSGNRGRCAQPCRLPYTYRDKTAAWLSPRDVCLRDELPALERAGVASVKLEGRLKRPEYVATVASSYRRAMDSLDAGTFRPADEAEKRELLQIFQRGGLMRGYVMGCEDADVICPERVNHGGVPIGQVEAAWGDMARVRLTLALGDGDGLQFRGAAGDQEMIYAGPGKDAGEIAVVRLRAGMRVGPGDAVVRLTDSAQLARAQAMTIPPIPVRMTLTALPEEALTLEATDGISRVSAAGEAVSPARSRAMTEEDARRSLEKTGDTPFALTECEVRTDGAFVPVSALNALRREVLAQLAQARTEAFARPLLPEGPMPEVALPKRHVPDMVIFRTMPQCEAASESGARLAWYPEDFRREALEAGIEALPPGCWLQLPTACEEDTLQMLADFAGAHRDRLGGVVLGSVGQLGAAWDLPIGAGAGVPVMNCAAARLLMDAGCEFVTASPELTGAELAALTADAAPILVPAWGRTQLMLLHHCPARTYLGLRRGHAACRLCDEDSPDALRGTSLRDRRGCDFPLLRQRLPEGCLVRLMNMLPTDNVSKARQAGYAVMMEMTCEDGAEAAAAMRGAAACPTTRGHWKTPVV